MWLFDFIDTIVDGFCEFVFFSILFFMKLFVFFCIVTIAGVVIYDNLANIFIIIGCACIVILFAMLCEIMRSRLTAWLKTRKHRRPA